MSEELRERLGEEIKALARESVNDDFALGHLKGREAAYRQVLEWLDVPCPKWVPWDLANVPCRLQEGHKGDCVPELGK